MSGVTYLSIAMSLVFVWAAIVNLRLHASTKLKTFGYFGAFYITGAVLWVYITIGSSLVAWWVGYAPTAADAVRPVRIHLAIITAGLLVAAVFWTAASCYRWFREYDDWHALLRGRGSSEGRAGGRVARAIFLGIAPADLRLSGKPSSVHRWEGVLMGVTYLAVLPFIVVASHLLPRVLWGRLQSLVPFLHVAGWTVLLWLAGCSLAIVFCALKYGRPGWRWSR